MLLMTGFPRYCPLLPPRAAVTRHLNSWTAATSVSRRRSVPSSRGRARQLPQLDTTSGVARPPLLVFAILITTTTRAMATSPTRHRSPRSMVESPGCFRDSNTRQRCHGSRHDDIRQADYLLPVCRLIKPECKAGCYWTSIFLDDQG